MFTRRYEFMRRSKQKKSAALKDNKRGNTSIYVSMSKRVGDVREKVLTHKITIYILPANDSIYFYKDSALLV